MSLDEIVESFRKSGPPCTAYIGTVASLARRIGGGRGAPVPYLLDRLGKEYLENKTLGEEFVIAVDAFDGPKIDKVPCL